MADSGFKPPSFTLPGTLVDHEKKYIAKSSKKDFIDLYALEQRGISVSFLISRLSDKYPGSSINYYHIVKSLVFFEDADQEPMPRMLQSIVWNEVKEHFIRLQKPLLDFISDV